MGLAGCSNTPYPDADVELGTVYYSSFANPPKDLDPQRAYTTADGTFLSLCYERLLAYDYLERPVNLVPELALAVPEPEEMRDESGALIGIRYSFDLQPGIHFVDDPCFPEGKGRELKAEDFVFVFKRLADPNTSCPVVASFRHIRGFQEYRDKLKELRATMKEEALAENTPEGDIRISYRDLYERAGPLPGVDAVDEYRFELTLDTPYPHILYWLAMRFCAAIPWEAVDHYNGQFGLVKEREPMTFEMRPVGTGPYQFKWDEYNREAKIVLVQNPNWWGYRYPERRAPTTIFPEAPGMEEDRELGIWTPEAAGRTLATVDRLEWYLEREALSRFNKFLQGYYDGSGIPLESFDQVIQEEDLTPEMEERGIRLVKDFGLDVYYIGFNMQDEVIGAPLKFEDPALEANREEELEKRRKLRQAMSLAIDTREYLRIFANNLGVPAQGPLPPGIVGYDPDYKNPYRQYDPELKLAKRLLEEAGYKNGVDPRTGKALTMTYDAGNTSTRSRAVFNFYIDAWKKLGIDVQLAATDYNKFQKKMYAGNFQIFSWGWLADYPDPENFMFLLYGPNSGRHDGHNPNHAWYENKDYDVVFKRMESLANDASATWTETDPETGEEREVTRTRYELIRELVHIAQEDCPWIPLSHSEDYILYHEWLHHAKPHPLPGSRAKYLAIDKETRRDRRIAWNRPILWPGVVAGVAVILFVVPAIRTVRRERR